jgi:hypothetical protein
MVAIIPQEDPMNRNRRPLPKQTRKGMEKEIKKGQKLLKEEEPARTDSLTPEKALKKYPPKRQKVEKPLMDAVVKKMEIKKKKSPMHESKRTTPGDVPHRETPPAWEHREGERWEKTLTQQNKNSRKKLTSQLQKRSSKDPKQLKTPLTRKATKK